MRKDRDAELTLRGLNKLTKKQLKSRISWIKARVTKLEKLASGPWLVTRKNYANLFTFSLMK